MIESIKMQAICFLLLVFLAAGLPVMAESIHPATYFKIAAFENPVLTENGDRLYGLYQQPGTGPVVVRADLVSGKRDIVYSNLTGLTSNLLLSSNERLLSFMSDDVGDERHKLYIVDVNSQNYLVVTPKDKLDISCAFSHDENYIYAARGERIWGPRGIVRISTQTGDAKEIYNIEDASLTCNGLSDDGRYLLLRRYISNSEYHMALFDLKTETVDWFLKEKNTSADNAFFHKGKLFFTSNKGGKEKRAWSYTPGGKIEAFQLPIDGLLESFYINQTENLVVSYRDKLGGRVSLFHKSDDDAWKEVELASPGAVVSYVEIPRAASEPVIFTTYDGRPPVVSLYKNGKTEEIVNLNETGLSDDAFATTQSVLIKSFDGVEIPTHIIKPNFANAKNPLPMVMLVHGGPEEHVDAKFSSARQAIASAGFVVVTPNVRGSSGFGRAFMNMDNGDWGGAHIRDLLAVANFTVDLEYVAKRPRFIVGGSFGGFSVLSTITQYPDAFDGAVDLFGIADITSFIGGMSGPVQQSFIGEIGFDPVKEPEKAQALSPLANATKIATPLQIHQGIHDVRVLPKQSQTLAEVLKKNNTLVEYHEYEDGHGFSPPNERLMYKRMIEFLVGLRKTHK